MSSRQTQQRHTQTKKPEQKFKIIMSSDQIDYDPGQEQISENEDEILEKDEDSTEIVVCQYRITTAILKLWISSLNTGIHNWNFIPVVKAAAKQEAPKYPPKSRYKDLDIYKAPHYEYKEYEAEKDGCPAAKTKLMQSYLQPKVSYQRESICKTAREVSADYLDLQRQFTGFLRKNKNEFVKYMRDDKNLTVRRAFLAGCGGLGYYMTYARDRFIKRILGTTAGLLAGGALCFPKETDQTVRDTSFAAAKAAVAFYNRFCNRKSALRERVPCKVDLPKPPPLRKNKNVCKEDKNKKKKK